MGTDHPFSVVDLQALLLSNQPWSLASWYAEPLSSDRADGLLQYALRWQQKAFADNQSGLNAQLLSWIASYWLKGDAQMHYQTLLATQSSSREQALVELIHGQLLISVKREGAHEALARGFKLAAKHLNSDDYFVLMKRHALLAFVPTQLSPARPQPLTDLLTEAQVIKRLQKGRNINVKQNHVHVDTID